MICMPCRNETHDKCPGYKQCNCQHKTDRINVVQSAPRPVAESPNPTEEATDEG